MTDIRARVEVNPYCWFFGIYLIRGAGLFAGGNEIACYWSVYLCVIPCFPIVFRFRWEIRRLSPPFGT